MKKRWMVPILTAVLTASIFCIGETAFAKEEKLPKKGKNITAVAVDEVYDQHDLTGDGKKDAFKCTAKQADSKEIILSLYVNDEKIGKVNLLRGGNIDLCQVDEDTCLLLVTRGQYGANIAEAYTCEDGKLKKVESDFEEGDYSLDYIEPYAVEGESIFMMTVAGRHDRLALSMEKELSFLVEYEYKGGELSLVSNYVKFISEEAELEAATSFKTSTSPNTEEKDDEGVAVKRGDEVEILQGYFTKKERNFQIKVDGKKGWMISPASEKEILLQSSESEEEFEENEEKNTSTEKEAIRERKEKK